MENLAKAIISVMKEVEGMEKNSRVGTGKAAYDGTKDQDVKEVFNEALAKNGLCILPIDIQDETTISRWEETNNYGSKQKQSVFTKVKTKYLLLHESGESQVLSGYGHGVDPQDKGAGKATTYALKNCLLLTFLTPVGKMPDTDLIHSDDMEPPLEEGRGKFKLIEEIKIKILDTSPDDKTASAKLLALTGNKAKSTKQLESWDYVEVSKLHKTLHQPEL